MRLFLRRARSASGQRPTVSPISPILWFDHFGRMSSRERPILRQDAKKWASTQNGDKQLTIAGLAIAAAARSLINFTGLSQPGGGPARAFGAPLCCSTRCLAARPHYSSL